MKDGEHASTTQRSRGWRSATSFGRGSSASTAKRSHAAGRQPKTTAARAGIDALQQFVPLGGRCIGRMSP